MPSIGTIPDTLSGIVSGIWNYIPIGGAQNFHLRIICLVASLLRPHFVHVTSPAHGLISASDFLPVGTIQSSKTSSIFRSLFWSPIRKINEKPFERNIDVGKRSNRNKIEIEKKNIDEKRSIGKHQKNFKEIILIFR